MTNLTIKFDDRQYNSLMQQFRRATPAQIDKAITRAAKRAATSARTETVRQMGSEYTLPASERRKDISVRGLTDNPGAQMRIAGYVAALKEFKGVTPRGPMPPSKGPVKAQVKKQGSKKEIDNAFVAKMESGHIGVFERTDDAMTKDGRKTKARLPITQLYGPSTKKSFVSNSKVNEAAVHAAGEMFEKRIIHELERMLHG